MREDDLEKRVEKSKTFFGRIEKPLIFALPNEKGVHKKLFTLQVSGERFHPANGNEYCRFNRKYCSEAMGQLRDW